MNIIFMGTPDFALPSLNQLISSKHHKVVAVFTQPPKPKGRGMKIEKSPVHQLADENNITVYNPATLKSLESLNTILAIDADIIIVVAYGFIIPKNIIDSKKYGCLNIHPSKLPKYRGAAPLQRTIIDGNTETGVCIMQMDEGLDTGDIILQENFSIPLDIILTELHDKCANLGATLLLKVLDNIENLPRIKQQEEGVVYASKLTKDEGKVNWHESAFSINCKVRGMNPWPGVFFTYKEQLIKIIESSSVDIPHDYSIGQLINQKFEVACGKGVLHIKIIQPAGKAKMLAEDYLKGINDSESLIILS